MQQVVAPEDLADLPAEEPEREHVAAQMPRVSVAERGGAQRVQPAASEGLFGDLREEGAGWVGPWVGLGLGALGWVGPGGCARGGGRRPRHEVVGHEAERCDVPGGEDGDVGSDDAGEDAVGVGLRRREAVAGWGWQWGPRL